MGFSDSIDCGLRLQNVGPNSANTYIELIDVAF
jgi:hypothetical protein